MALLRGSAEVEHFTYAAHNSGHCIKFESWSIFPNGPKRSTKVLFCVMEAKSGCPELLQESAALHLSPFSFLNFWKFCRVWTRWISSNFCKTLDSFQRNWEPNFVERRTFPLQTSYFVPSIQKNDAIGCFSFPRSSLIGSLALVCPGSFIYCIGGSRCSAAWLPHLCATW